MELDVVRVKADESWRLEHRAKAGKHNHPPSFEPFSHPIHRRADRTREICAAIATDSETGHEPVRRLHDY